MRRGQGVGDQNFTHQQVSVHGVTDYLGNLGVSKLNEAISFGPSCDLGPGQFHSQDISVL